LFCFASQNKLLTEPVIQAITVPSETGNFLSNPTPVCLSACLSRSLYLPTTTAGKKSPSAKRGMRLLRSKI